jgi:hypothetical protein
MSQKYGHGPLGILCIKPSKGKRVKTIPNNVTPHFYRIGRL